MEKLKNWLSEKFQNLQIKGAVAADFCADQFRGAVKNCTGKKLAIGGSAAAAAAIFFNGCGAIPICAEQKEVDKKCTIRIENFQMTADARAALQKIINEKSNFPHGAEIFIKLISTEKGPQIIFSATGENLSTAEFFLPIDPKKIETNSTGSETIPTDELKWRFDFWVGMLQK